jgi:membrane protease YdiL (CAAX protease family)
MTATSVASAALLNALAGAGTPRASAGDLIRTALHWLVDTRAVMLGALALIAVVEMVFVYGSAAVSAILALLLALGLAGAAAVLPVRTAVARCLEALALVPLYILLTASLPWFFLDRQLWLPVIYALVLVLCLWHLQGRYVSIVRLLGLHLGRRGLARAALLGLAIGIPSGTVEYIVLPQPAVPVLDAATLLRDVVYMLFFVGLGEELLFRGIIQRELTEAIGWKWGLFLASLLFSIMHLTWRSAPELVFTFLAGAFFGYLYRRTGNLAACTVYHAVNNVMLVAIAPHFLPGLAL